VGSDTLSFIDLRIIVSNTLFNILNYICTGSMINTSLESISVYSSSNDNFFFTLPLLHLTATTENSKGHLTRMCFYDTVNTFDDYDDFFLNCFLCS